MKTRKIQRTTSAGEVAGRLYENPDDAVEILKDYAGEFGIELDLDRTESITAGGIDWSDRADEFRECSTGYNELARLIDTL